MCGVERVGLCQQASAKAGQGRVARAKLIRIGQKSELLLVNLEN